MKRFWPSLVLAVVLPVLGCGGSNREDENASATERGAIDTESGYDNDINDPNRLYTPEEMTAYGTQLQQDLQELDQRMEHSGQTMQSDMHQRLQARRQMLQSRIDSLQTATGSQWTMIRIRIDRDMQEIRQELDSTGQSQQSR